MCETFQHPELATQLLEAKAEALRESIRAGGPADNFKRPAGDFYNAAKRLFADRKLGSNSRAFMKGFCAPLIRPGTATYDELRRDVFGE